MFLTKREVFDRPLFDRPMFDRPTFGFRSLRHEMDRLFDDWMREMEPMDLPQGSFMPSIDVIETDKHLQVKAELPGMTEKDVEVELTPDFLTLRGKKEVESVQEGDNWYRNERRFGSFERAIPLPWKVDDDKAKIDAVFKNGMLEIKVAKPKQARPRTKKVEVKPA